jgi:phage terminase Nu1 subunit (DNA packaging protein)
MSTQAECAEHLFISAQRFRDLLDAGVITRQPTDGYDLDDVRREALTHLRALASNRGAGENLSKERALLAKSQRELSELKTRQLAGQLVEVEGVCFQIENRYAVVRECLLSIPGKCADELTRRERHEIVEILRREINEALGELYEPARIIEEAGGVRPDRDSEDETPWRR